jgi:hypothetical protein
MKFYVPFVWYCWPFIIPTWYIYTKVEQFSHTFDQWHWKRFWIN